MTERTAPNRRAFLAGATGLATFVASPYLARAPVPVIRYALGGGVGPNGIDSLFFTEFMRKNVLKRYGKDYTTEVTFTRGTPEAASLLAAGQADLAQQACPSLATVIARNAVPGGVAVIANVQDVRAGYSNIPFYVLDRSSIRQIGDLRGKIIAVNAFGTFVDLILRTVLRKNGLDPRRDVRIVEISFPSIGPALREGRVEVGVLPIPYNEIEASKGSLREIFNATDAFPDAFSNLFQVARREFLSRSPEAVRAWLEDYVQGLRWLYEPANRAQAVALAADVSKSDPALLDGFFLTKKDYYRDVTACLTPRMLQGPLDAMVEQGLLASPIDIASHVDTGYLPRPC